MKSELPIEGDRARGREMVPTPPGSTQLRQPGRGLVDKPEAASSRWLRTKRHQREIEPAEKDLVVGKLALATADHPGDVAFAPQPECRRD